ncbi:hypothetical protein [Microtetraspora malaysiensis]|uniref:hypothetical protein n=1 Tax=Microtetraspora malaysiensis TaxID=161358 RepID=UPI003D8A18FE
MLLKNSFEGGTNGQSITTANSGGVSGTAFPSTAEFPPTYSNVHAAHGTLSARFPADHKDSYLSWEGLIPGNGDRWIRAYLWVDQPTDTAHDISLNLATAGYATQWIAQVQAHVATGTCELELRHWNDSTQTETLLATASVAPAIGQWIRVEMRVNNASSGTAEVRLYNDADSTTASATITGTITQSVAAWHDVYVYNQSWDATAWVDDFAVSDTGWLGPEVASEAHSGGSSATVTTSPTGSGMPGARGGQTATVSAAASAGGGPGFAGGSSATITVSPQGAGVPGGRGGSTTTVTVTAAGGGTAAAAGGSSTAVTVTATGGGDHSGAAGGSSATVAIASAGDGFPGFAGGSSATVAVNATAAGTPRIASGTAALVKVAATGGGRQVVVDITVTIGPAQVRERVAVGPTCRQAEVGSTRASTSTSPTRVRERVAVSPSAVRERVTVAGTRTSVEVATTRTSTTVGPSRTGRGA